MAAPGAASRVSGSGSASATGVNVAFSGVGGIGVLPGPSRATTFWVLVLFAGPVPPHLLASRLGSLARTKNR